MSVWASPVPPSLSVAPGEEATLDVKVRNIGAVVDEFRFEVLGGAATWSEISPGTLNLLPGAEGSATLRLRPPRLSSTAAGAVPMALRVTSEDDPAGSVTQQTVVHVSCYSAVTVTVVPQTSHGRRSAQHTITVKNGGNCPIQAEPTASDPDELLRFSAVPSSIAVGPDATAIGALTVRARHRLLRGRPQPKPFTLVVDGGDEPVEFERVFVQKPLLPNWLLALMAVLGGLVLFFAIQEPLPTVLLLVLVIMVLLAAALVLAVFLMIRALLRRRSG